MSDSPTSATFPDEAPAGDTFLYGPDIADERSLRLLGIVDDKRILELGAGSGRNAVALARQGARVVSIDPSQQKLDRSRKLAERQEVRLELHRSELADIAFLRADTIDVVVSVYALATVEDIDRVFRQAHRVLRAECPLVVSLPHPAWLLLEPGSEPPRVEHSWFDRSPRPWRTQRERGVEYPRTFSDLVGALHRAGFRLEAVLEPEPDPEGRFRSPWWSDTMRKVPATLILRARKLGT